MAHSFRSEKMLRAVEPFNQTKSINKQLIPSFIIIGVQKSGTTSLYEYLRHPLVILVSHREIHFFDWHWNSSLSSTTSQRDFYMNYFNTSAIEKNPSLITGEASPSYILNGDIVIPRMQAVCPWAKILVILRNPVDRAYSLYNMCVDPIGTPEQLKVRQMSAYINKSFEQVVDEEMSYLSSFGITPTSSYEDFKRLVLMDRTLMTHGGYSLLLARGFYALQLEPWLQKHFIRYKNHVYF